MKAASAWEKVAGPTVSAHTTGAHLREGELVIHVDSNAWATELSSLAGPYLEKMRDEMGETPMRSIRFTVSKKVGAEKKVKESEKERSEFYRPDDTPSIPLSRAEMEQVEASASVITDPELKEIAIRATVADLEGKKGRAAAKSREAASEGL